MTNPVATTAKIESIDDRSNDVRIITLLPFAPFTWRAGQYAHLSTENEPARSFSIASAPNADGRISFHIRNSGKGMSAYLGSARVGDAINLEGPFGDMTTEHARGRPVLMVAGGTGIAPMLALAADILRKGLTEEGITLIYGARSDADIYCRRELETLVATGDVTLHVTIGTSTPDQELRRLGLNLAHHIIYLSGPDPMMVPVRKVMLDHLADPARIFTDVRMDDLLKAQS